MNFTPEELQQLGQLDETQRVDLLHSLPLIASPTHQSESSLSSHSNSENVSSPQGSRNINTKPPIEKIPKRRGRPPGTGHVQLAIARGELAVEKKRKRGRPRKSTNFGAPSTRYRLSGSLFIPGVPAKNTTTKSTSTPSTNMLLSTSSRSKTPTNDLRGAETHVNPDANTTYPSVPPTNEPVPSEGSLPVLNDDGNNVDSPDALLEEGIGEDDGDDTEPSMTNTAAPSSKVPLRPLPTWLKAIFDTHVKASQGRGSDGLPPLYRDHQTFWFPKPSPFFKLCNLENLTPQQFWDARILSILPAPLAAEFPATLTYRSGIATDVLYFMRTCFQHGMGARQFSNALLVQHLQNYDLLQLRYFQTLAPEAGSLFAAGPFARKFKMFLPFDDRSIDGLQGFVPSGQWLRDVYDTLIDGHRDELNQHMSMLTARICAVDHSFKLAKHVAKINGVPIFTALLSITNEKGEIRGCNLVTNKTHSQYEPALIGIGESLDRYGHEQPELFYTDSMVDKEFLEKCFPSLKKDVVPIEKHSHLNELQIPDKIEISIKQSSTAIDDAMRTIIESLPDDETGSVVIGLDAEWNVEVSQHGYVTGRGQTAILQIAHGTNIFILQVGHILAGNQLPSILKQVLANPRIIKVGRCVTGDLKYLQQACGSQIPFVGGLDIGKLAKDRLLVSTARTSLADLCATILKRRLNKNTPVRISSTWDSHDLTEDQIRYAAVDAHASLSVYNPVISIPSPQCFSTRPEVGTPVLLFSNDNTRVVARGVVSQHQNNSNYMNINITPTRAVIEVQQVLVPGALIANGVLPQHALESFGHVPFHIVCLYSHLRQPASSETSCKNPAHTLDQPDNHVNPERTVNPHSAAGTSSPIFVNTQDDSSGFGHILAEVPQSNEELSFESRQNFSETLPDADSQAEGEKVLSSIDSSTWSKDIRSRVLKDPFHVFNQFYISSSHGLLQEFSTALRDALFIWDQSDKARLIAWGRMQNPPLSWDDIVFNRSHWLLRRCKRIIPPAEQLFPLVKRVFETFGPLKDAKTGLPLFNSAAWAVAKNILLLIQNGHLSDPPDIPLYYQLGIDAKTGLPLYRCMRGTNMTEGGVHTHLRSRLPCSGVSVRHTQCSLLDFIIRHNLLVGTFNSTGKRYVGHYSIWITNKLQEMLALVQHMLICPPQIHGWVNGNLYLQTNEVAGILPIPVAVQTQAAMGRYIASAHGKQPHYFLASMQGTRKPVLPVHNSQERKLFHDFMSGNNGFNHPTTGPNWDVAVQLWNNVAETRDKISYKLPEQLKVYYNGDWKRNVNIKQTKAMTADARLPLRNTLRDPQRSLTAPKVPETVKTLHTASKGLDLAPGTLPTAPSPTSTTSSSPPTPAPTNLPSNQLSSPQSATAVQQHIELATGLARKRALDSFPEPPSKRVRQTPQERKARTCRKCALQDCKGKKERLRKIRLSGKEPQPTTETMLRGEPPPTPVLQVPELLTIVFTHASDASNIVNAQVCRCWGDVVEPVLWREINSAQKMQALLELIGPWTFLPDENSKDFPQQPQWEKFLCRAKFVKSITYTPSETGDTDFRLRFISETRPLMSHPFPNLESLTFTMSQRTSWPFPLCTMFASPQLRDINFDFSQDSNIAISFCLPLTSLGGLRGFKITAQNVQNLNDIIRRLRGLPKLDTLAIPLQTTSLRILEAASELPALERLLSTNKGGPARLCSCNDGPVEPNLTLVTGCFPVLTTLTIAGCVPELSNIIQHPHFPVQITALEVDHLQCSNDGNDFTLFHSYIAGICPGLTAYFLHSSGPTLSFAELQPLLSLKLDHLLIKGHEPLNFIPGELRELAASLPNLTQLYLNQSPYILLHGHVESNIGFTIDLLPDIAQSCPNLQSLGILLNTSHVPTGGLNILPFRACLRQMDLGLSPLKGDNSNVIATYLAQILPKNCELMVDEGGVDEDAWKSLRESIFFLQKRGGLDLI
ncbi:hypothetical protein H0H93_013330 [Arthromyces matolae]|nr:hypothetical protein H0H93_013330 [Arthromyces matolae]